MLKKLYGDNHYANHKTPCCQTYFICCDNRCCRSRLFFMVSAEKRSLITIGKSKSTPPKYPRKPGTPAKKPFG